MSVLGDSRGGHHAANAAEPLRAPHLYAQGPRRLALSLHQHLRQLILEGTLTPGTVLSQAEFARSLGVSRTPMREAFRMLQEEGLIHAEPDRRAVVVGLNVADLDSMYATRILLEALAVSMTVPTASGGTVKAMEQALRRMHELRAKRRRSPVWTQAHDEFHRLATGGADVQMAKTLVTLREQTRRYLRLAQSSTQESWLEGEGGHELVLDAFRSGDAEAAVSAMVTHLATTALRVMSGVDPGRDLPAVSAALAMLAKSCDAETLRSAVARRADTGGGSGGSGPLRTGYWAGPLSAEMRRTTIEIETDNALHCAGSAVRRGIHRRAWGR
jgi:DNA-binding GntR family transcriptional regulator